MTMLKLAQAVYPDNRAGYPDSIVTDDSWGLCVWVGENPCVFDPENNAEQFCDVLAWLLSNYEAAINGDDVTVYIGNQQYAYTPHDGTAAGIRNAVLQAALRCV